MPRHIRYNIAASKYEFCDDATGTADGPWATLPLGNNVSDGTIPNVAYVNVANTFSAKQTVTGGSGTSIHLSPIEIILASNPRIGFHWPGVVASSIGMNSAGAIRTYNNPGTDYESFEAARVYTSTTGNNLGDLTVRGTTNFQNGVTVTNGNISTPHDISGRTITAEANIHNTAGYVYPGRYDAGGGWQGNWYLSSHASYGLYTNSGIAAATSLFALGGECYAETGFRERGRGYKLGEWINSAHPTNYYWASAGTWSVTSVEHYYSFIGRTMICNLIIHAGSLSAAAGFLHFYIPAVGASQHVQACFTGYWNGGQGACLGYVNATLNYFNVAPPSYIAGGMFPAGTMRIYGTYIIPF